MCTAPAFISWDIKKKCVQAYCMVQSFIVLFGATHRRLLFLERNDMVQSQLYKQVLQITLSTNNSPI